MSEAYYTVAVIVAMAVVTFLLRALPFMASRWLKAHDWVERAGKFLPLAVMTLLVVHSAWGAMQTHENGPWFEMAALSAVALLQWKWRHTLLSMCVGTTLYVVLRNIPL